MDFVQTDGGRVAGGFRGKTRDCVARSIAIVTGKAYSKVYEDLNVLAALERQTKRMARRSSSRTGVHKKTYRRYLEHLGFTWIPTMFVGQGCKVHLRPDELPRGRLVVEVSGHVTAVIDGVIHDNHDCSRGGRRCVYGYWRQV